MNYQDFVSFLKELGLSEFGISVVIAVLIAVYILVKLFQFFFQNNQTRESKQFDILNKIIDDKEYLEKISSKPYLIRQLFFTRLYTLKRFQTYEIDFLLSELDMKINLYQLKTLKSLHLIEFIDNNYQLKTSPINSFWKKHYILTNIFASLLLVVSGTVLLLFIVSYQQFLPLLVFGVIFLLFFEIYLINKSDAIKTFKDNEKNIKELINRSKEFKKINSIIKPYALMDLDDTLFQTQRKIDAWELPTSEPENLVCATVNKQGKPLSFMSQRQAAFFNWLLLSTELIVVTARDRSEIKRVKLPFDSWQVLTHGAIILDRDGALQTHWQQHMHSQLAPLQDKLQQLSQLFANHSRNDNSQLVFTPHIDHFNNGADNEALTIYLAIKHGQKDHQALVELAKKLPTLIRDFEQDFYVHVNANNLAILPHAVHKRHAVQFLLDQHLDNQRPSFGFGDSLADLPFLQLLDWYGMPNHGQLHERFSSQ